MRDKIWATLCDLKFKGYCLEFLVNKFQNWDRNINIFLAVASSGSIAAWAIWNMYPFIWGGIIALSQVLTVVKPYFPYFKYVKELNAKSVRLDLLNIEFERLWYNLQYDKVTVDKGAEKYFELRKQMIELLNFADDTIFNVNNKIVNKSNHKMKIYLQNNYGITIILNK